MDIKTIKAHIAYYYARLKADHQYRLSGERQFVMMTDNGKLMVMSRHLFYRLRKRGIMPQRITPRMLTKISVYYTAAHCNTGAISAMDIVTAKHRKQRYLEFVSKI